MEDYQIIVYLNSDDSLNDDMLSVGFKRLPELVLEYKLYKSLKKTGYYYREDKANNAPGQQRHFHIYRDTKGKHQICAITEDGTPHDGSSIALPPKVLAALQELGVEIPTNAVSENNEQNSSSKSKTLLCD